MKIPTGCASVFFCVLLTATASAQNATVLDKPTWYPDHTLDYPSSKFLVMTGEGTDAATARNDAIGQLADYFGIDVSSVSTGTLDYQEAKTKKVTQSKLESSISSKIQIKSNQKLFNTETTPSYQVQPNRVVVLAYINRETGLTAWDALEKTVINKLKTCLARVSKTDIPMSTRLAAYTASQSLFAQIDDIETKRKLIQPSASVLLDPSLRVTYDSLTDSFLILSVISVDISGDQADDIKSLVSDALSNAGFMTGTSGTLVLQIRSTIKKTESAYGLSGSQWKLDLTFVDGNVNAVSVSLQGKSSGSSAEKSQEKLMTDVQAQLETKFISELINRLVKTLE